MNALRPTLLLAAALLAACGDPDPSSSIPTERIYARYVAEARADGTSTMTAEYLEDEDPWIFYYEGVYLDGGDTVTFRVKDEQVALPGGDHYFVADLVSGIVEDTRFEFDLQRPAFADAPGSSGTLPAPMTLQWPEPGAEYSIADDDITVFWSSAGTLDDMYLRVVADCTEPVGEDGWWLDEEFRVEVTGDPGLASIDLSDYAFFRTEECRRFDATLTLVRARSGTVDAALAPDENTCGGNNQPSCRHLEYVSVRQVRSVPVVLRP